MLITLDKIRAETYITTPVLKSSITAFNLSKVYDYKTKKG